MNAGITSRGRKKGCRVNNCFLPIALCQRGAVYVPVACRPRFPRYGYVRLPAVQCGRCLGAGHNGSTDLKALDEHRWCRNPARSDGR